MRKDLKLLLILLAVLITLASITQFLQTGGVREGLTELTINTFLSQRVYSCNRYSIHENLLGNYVVVEYNTDSAPQITGGFRIGQVVSRVWVVKANHADALTWGVRAIAAGTPLPELVQRIGIPVSNNDHHGNTIQYGSLFRDPLGNQYMVQWTDNTRSVAASVSYVATQEHPVPVEQVWPNYACAGLFLVGLVAMVLWIVRIIRKNRLTPSDTAFRPPEDAAPEAPPQPPQPTSKGRSWWKPVLLVLIACVSVFFNLFSRYDTRGLLPGMTLDNLTLSRVADAQNTRNHLIYENRFGKLVIVETKQTIVPLTDSQLGPSITLGTTTHKTATLFHFIDLNTTSRSLYAAASIREGMHLTDVIQKLGKPDSTGMTGTATSILFYNWDNYSLQITFRGDTNRVTTAKLTENSNGKILTNPAFDPEFMDIFLMIRSGILLLSGVAGAILLLVNIDWHRKPVRRQRKPADDAPETVPSDDEFNDDDDEGFRPIF